MSVIINLSRPIDQKQSQSLPQNEMPRETYQPEGIQAILWQEGKRFWDVRDHTQLPRRLQHRPNGDYRRIGPAIVLTPVVRLTPSSYA